MIRVFEENKQCWLKPRSGCCNVSTAEFVVVGRPFRDKLRPLSPPLRRELDSQLDSMLKAGVIRPCRSQWGSVPVFVQKKMVVGV